jgi:hypothetical protein
VSQADDLEPPLSPEEELELLTQLRAALRPGELDPEAHEQLLALALEEPLSPPSEAELVESQRLRDALESGDAHPDADVLRALGAAFTAVDDAKVERALAALERAPAQAPQRRANVVYVLFGAGSAALAVAAAVALFVAGGPQPAPDATRSAAALVRPRSTTELFDDRFETSGTTARMDRIASARRRDLRDNRYAAWGVR